MKSKNSDISARNCVSGLQIIEISINFCAAAQCFSYRLRRLPPAGVPYVHACVQCVVCNSCWVGRSLQFRMLTWLVETAFHKSSCALEQYCFLPPRQISAGKGRYLLILFVHVFDHCSATNRWISISSRQNTHKTI